MENIEPTTIVILKSNLKGYKFGKEAENFMKEQRTDEYIYFDEEINYTLENLTDEEKAAVKSEISPSIFPEIKINLKDIFELY